MTDLVEMAAAINDEHRACARAFRAGLAHAIRAGELLAQAKAAIPHGEWLPWLGDHFEGSPRTAQIYMRVANQRAALERPDAQRTAHLSLREAVAELAAPRVKPRGDPIDAHFGGIVDRLNVLRGRLELDDIGLAEVVAIAEEAANWEIHCSVDRIDFERLAGQALAEAAAP